MPQHRLAIDEGEVVPIVLLPGDPGRAVVIASPPPARSGQAPPDRTAERASWGPLLRGRGVDQPGRGRLVRETGADEGGPGVL